ncbi:MAG: hypothetical protein JWL95_1144 [Gemmatimonadetes bacterium]|nr:hypothetical protein [Gemmatimonadota bacterium]
MRPDEWVSALRNVATLQAKASSDGALQQILEASKIAHAQATGEERADLETVIEAYRAEIARKAAR